MGNSCDKLFTISHRCLLELPFLFKALRKERFDTVLVFHLSQRPTLPLCYFAKPSLIIGSEGINKGLDFLLTVKLPRKHQHEIQRRLDIVNQIGATTQQPLLEIFVNQKEKTTAKAFVESLPENSMLIALHPGSKDAFKQWAPSAFIALGQKLQKELHAHLLITGNSEEHALAQHISDAIPFSINIAGKFSIRELAALFPYLAVLVTNDTGPMHLGFATKTPTVALFSATDPHLCGPFAAKDAIVLYQKKTCHPCLGKSCRDAFCMLQHSPRDVFNHILTLLNLKKISGAAS
jgi:ADP-heptose:LPS heptosyltransferase